MTKSGYFALLRDSIKNTTAETADGGTLDLEESLHEMRAAFYWATGKDKKVIFIGNGGSSAIASHMAADISKNGGVRAVAFNDISALTMLGNDFGYDAVFSKQLEFYGFTGDVLVAISSSGGSRNILQAAEKALEMQMKLYTFTGLVRTADNKLRKMGAINFVVPCTDYGIVELAHASLIHSVI